jgi:hypothetical protein
MIEEVWRLRRENAQLKMALAQANAQIMQSQYDAAKAELAALGEKWEPETGDAEH